MIQKPVCPHCPDIVELQETTEQRPYFDQQEQITREVDISLWKCSACSYTQPITIEEKREMRLWENKIRFREQEMAEKKEHIHETVKKFNEERFSIEDIIHQNDTAKHDYDGVGSDYCVSCWRREKKKVSPGPFCPPCWQEITKTDKSNYSLLKQK